MEEIPVQCSVHGSPSDGRDPSPSPDNVSNMLLFRWKISGGISFMVQNSIKQQTQICRNAAIQTTILWAQI